ncbi:MAG: gamma-glutamyltranspeptidase/glutathione hydrolase [Paracoccaceae bacterium]|jgi:gamma-glutamyltranspeptidase/glutathione hydrolase
MRDFHFPGRSAVFSTNGMCATSNPLASQVALSILQAGGNAVDAAIAGATLLGLCEPQMTGIGGDCFILLKEGGSNKIVALNGSGRSPKGLNSKKLTSQGETAVPVHSADAVTIPGAVDAFLTLSKDYGKLGIEASLAPSILYAEEGVPVGPRTSFDWCANEKNLQGVARNYYLIGGLAPKPGQIFKAPKQADILRKISKHGRDAFYKGEIAEDMVSSLRKLGGSHTLEDFASTSCEYTDPISGNYKEIELVEHPPNGHGATAILMNNILKQFDIASLEPFGSVRAHLEAEAAKLAYDARNRFLADADYVTRLEHMLSEDIAKDLASLIDPKKAMVSPGLISEQVHKDTIYITVVDQNQMAVSLIYSIFHSFGSGIASDKYGILFQNRGAGFNLSPGHPNEVGGNKRPMHTIIPGMLKKNNKVIMPFGVMGGAYQPNGHSRFITNMVDFGMNPQSAIDGPRAFSDQGTLKIERSYSPKVIKELEELGHVISIPDEPIGGAQAILINYENGVLEGASDPRKDGCALGY